MKKGKLNLPPIPPIFDKDKLLQNINNRLVELKSGNYLVKLLDLKNPRRHFCSYESYYDIEYQIVNLNDLKATKGLIVPGMGKDPIDLNKKLRYYDGLFYENYHYTFEEQLWNKLSRMQTSINEEGHYAKVD